VTAARKTALFAIFALVLTASGAALWLKYCLKQIVPYPYALGESREPKLDHQIEFYRDRLKKSPESAMDWADLAALEIDQAKITSDVSGYDRAEEAATRSLKILPIQNPRAEIALAQVAESRHFFREAIESAEKILADKPDQSGALAVLATSALARGELKRGLEAADQLVHARPTLGNFVTRALILIAQGRTREAELDFAAGFKVEEFGETFQSAWARTIYGRYLLSRGRLREARSALQESLRVFPNFHFALDVLGLTELADHRPREALALFEKAFNSSKQLLYLIHQAQARSAAGDPAAGKTRDLAEDLARAELAKNAFGHRLELVKILLSRKNDVAQNEALTLLEQDFHSRVTAELLAAEAAAYLNLGQLEPARVAIQAALATGAREAEYDHLAGLVEQKLQNSDRAAFYLKRALRTRSGFDPRLGTLTPEARY
jgi:tetratricopeptide (TPR) repeat protein